MDSCCPSTIYVTGPMESIECPITCVTPRAIQIALKMSSALDKSMYPSNGHCSFKCHGSTQKRATLQCKTELFELRRHKLSVMSQLMNAVYPSRVVFAHLKSIEADSERFIQDIVKAVGLELSSNQLQESASEHSLLSLLQEEYAIAQQEIDWEMESRFGFTPFDCRTCA
jgi:hypothetical protein